MACPWTCPWQQHSILTHSLVVHDSGLALLDRTGVSFTFQRWDAPNYFKHWWLNDEPPEVMIVFSYSGCFVILCIALVTSSDHCLEDHPIIEIGRTSHQPNPRLLVVNARSRLANHYGFSCKYWALLIYHHIWVKLFILFPRYPISCGCEAHPVKRLMAAGLEGEVLLKVAPMHDAHAVESASSSSFNLISLFSY